MISNTNKELVRSGMICVLDAHEMGFARELADCIEFTDGRIIVESAPPATFLSQHATLVRESF